LKSAIALTTILVTSGLASPLLGAPPEPKAGTYLGTVYISAPGCPGDTAGPGTPGSFVAHWPGPGAAGFKVTSGMNGAGMEIITLPATPAAGVTT
jgi:hypothetical protein